MKRRFGFFKPISDHFFHMTIARKMLLGYVSLLVLLIMISGFSLFSLNRLNRINSRILAVDVPVLEASDKMIDAILSEELYARRYLILGTTEMMDLYWERNRTFHQLLNKLRTMPAHRGFPVEKLASLHVGYNTLLVDAMGAPDKHPVSRAFEKRIKTQQETMIGLVKKMAEDAQTDQKRQARKTATIGDLAFKVAAVLCAVGFLFSASATLLITRNISGAIKKLKLATELIAQGRFDHTPDIRNEDELGDLAEAFVTMAGRLKRLEEMYLDASPLTRLAGGVAIENILTNRIKAGAPIAFCLMDLDNFKAFNDQYGYARGNDFLKATAAVIEKAVADFGGPDDFIGHIGGDDFVLITAPDRYGGICTAVVDNFDRIASGFYDAGDRERGYIEGENRQGQAVRFPVATVSIAVVTNERRTIENHIHFGEIAAEVKEHAKSFKRSLYVVDQRCDGSDKSCVDNSLVALPNMEGAPDA